MGFAIEARALSKRFGRELVLDDVHLTVERGSIHALVGANGAGKSTLLRILTGAVWADVGSVHLFGELLPREAAALRQRVHFVGDGGAVILLIIVIFLYGLFVTNSRGPSG
ncbi:MAG: ATP-binding cassette domain-containing protein [Firmicutes bacterium]|nr:ATP-binding cassette domain-containing protein [Bacillota bacterium]